jgi:hypothetical protein
MGKKKKKFNQAWKNQTDLGKRFGLSAIAVGKILSEKGLKTGRDATQKALDEGYATSTPLKDGTPFYLWNTSKVSGIIGKDHQSLSNVELQVNEVRKRLQETDRLWNSDSGTDQKIASMTQGMEYDDVPQNIRAEVRQIIEGKK